MFKDLKIRILFFIFLFSMISSIISISMQGHIEYQNGHESLKKEFKKIRINNLGTIGLLLWDLDTDKIKLQLQGIIDTTDVEKIEITSEIQSFSVGKVASKKILKKVFPIEVQDGDNLNKVGELVLHTGLGPLNQRIRKTILTLSGAQLFLIFGLCLGTFLLFHALVTRHLDTIASFISNMNVKKLGTDVLKLHRNRKSNDQLDVVTDSFNNMTKTIYDYTNNLEQIVDERTKSIKMILNSIKQGIFSILPGGKIDEEYSLFLEKILEHENLSNMNLETALLQNMQIDSDRKSQIRTALEASLGKNAFNFTVNQHCFPKEFDLAVGGNGKKVKNLEADWRAVLDEKNNVQKIVCTLRDVSDLKEISKKNEEQKKAITVLSEMIGLGEKEFVSRIHPIINFCDQNEKILMQINKNESNLIMIQRNYHTAKGISRSSGFSLISSKLHDAETNVQKEIESKDDKNWNRDKLLTDIQKVRETIETYKEIAMGKLFGGGQTVKAGTEVSVSEETLSRFKAYLDEIDLLTDKTKQRVVLDKFKNDLINIKSKGIGRIIQYALESLPDLAKDLGKYPPFISIMDNNIKFRGDYHEMLLNCFTHLLRNSMDHGIEEPNERKESSKEEQGEISIWVKKSPEAVIITYFDDGRGIDLEKIKEFAIKQKLLLQNSKPSIMQLVEFLFEPGFSTATKVTEVSGRGIGLDAIKHFVEDQNGTIHIELTGNQKDCVPFEIKIHLPLNVCG